MRWLLALLVAAAACSDGKPGGDQPKADPQPTVEANLEAGDAPKTGDAPQSGDNAAQKSKPDKKSHAVSAETRAAYKKHLRAGRKLGKADDWKAAAEQFELALAQIPGDGRALSELGWAAFKAGDYKRARQANALSALAAGDPKIEAASLYNLGRVAEAQGDKDTAATAYKKSLTLRPNKTVEARLASLKAAATEDSFCTAPMATADVCECLTTAETWDEDVEWECRFEPDASSRYEVVELDATAITQTYMLARRAKGWVVFATGDETMSGSGGINEGYTASIEIRRVAGRDILEIRDSFERTDADAGINEYEESSTETVTFCVVPEDDDGVIECPLNVPLSESHTRELIDEDQGYDPAGDLEGRAYHHEWTLSVTLTDKGTVVVEKVSGELDEDTRKRLGEHKLL